MGDHRKAQEDGIRKVKVIELITRKEAENSITVYKNFDIDTNECKWIVTSKFTETIITICLYDMAAKYYDEFTINKKIKKAKEQLIDEMMDKLGVTNKEGDDLERRKD